MTPVVAGHSLLVWGLRCSWWSRARFVVIALASAFVGLTCLGISAVHGISAARGGPYSTAVLQQPAMRSGLLTGLALTLVPLVALIGQAAALGSPSRDQRLSVFRLAGASRNAVRLIVAVEAAFPSLVGAIASTALFVTAQRLLDPSIRVRGSWTTSTIVPDGPGASTEYSTIHHGVVRLLPTDIAPAPVAVALVVLLTPTAAVLATWFAVRTLQADPLAVARRERRSRPPIGVPVVSLLLGLGGLIGYSVLRSLLGQPSHATRTDVVLVVALFGLTSISLVTGSAAVAAGLGRWLADISSRPAWLIAGRRLEHQPFAASRSTALVILALVVAVSGQAVKAHFLVITDPDDPLYADTLRLVDVAYVLALVLACAGVLLRAFESMHSRDEELRAQILLGTPVSVLRVSAVVETVVPLLPGVLAAAVLGILGVRGVLGSGHAEVVGSGTHVHVEIVPIPIPWVSASVLVVLVLTVTTVATSMTFGALQRSRRALVEGARG